MFEYLVSGRTQYFKYVNNMAELYYAKLESISFNLKTSSAISPEQNSPEKITIAFFFLYVFS